MIDISVRRRLLRNAIGSLLVPFAAIGCQHQQVASTRPSSTLAVSSQNTGHKVAQASREAGHDVAQASRTAGHDVAQASRTAGHDVAEASRETYHATANGVRKVGSGTADLFANSAVPVRNTPPESLSAPIIDVDEAMQVRDWDQMTATYSSGATVAGPTGFLYRPHDDKPYWQDSAVGIPLFLVDSALMPLAFAKIPPWKPVEWKGATVQPTYTAVPPLPPAP